MPAGELAGSMRNRYQQLIAIAGIDESMTTGQMMRCAANSLLDSGRRYEHAERVGAASSHTCRVQQVH